MANRDGSLSSFPTSLDTFPVVSDGTIEDASYVNHYFDACLNLERYVLAHGGGGYPIQSFNTSQIPGSAILLSHSSLSYTTSGNIPSTLTLSGTVPSGFGNSPFADLNFAISATCHLTAPGSSIKGVWANSAWTMPEPLNTMLTWQQPYTCVSPTGTGRGFNVTIQFLQHFSQGSISDGSFFDDFTITTDASRPPLSSIWSSQGTSQHFSIYLKQYMHARVSTTLSPWLVWPKEFSFSPNQEIEFEYVNDNVIASVPNGWRFNFGPMVRANTDITNFSGYVVVFGSCQSRSVATSSKTTVQLIKVENQFIANQWNSNQTPYVDQFLGSVVTGVTHTTANVGVVQKYRLRAVGTTITLDGKNGGGAWTNLLTVTDSTLTTGRAGWFHTGSGYEANWNPGGLIFDNVYIRNVTSSSNSNFNVKVDLLYVKTGSDNTLVSV